MNPIKLLGLAATIMALHAGAAFKQTGQWHMFAGTYDYYLWNSKGSMVFVKGYSSNITISAWMSPGNQWVVTVPETHYATSSVVYVANDFKHLLIHTTADHDHELLAYAMNTKLTFLGNEGFGSDTGEAGPPQFSWAGKYMFIAQRLTATGEVFVGLQTPDLNTWRMKTTVQTWGGWSPKAAPVSISPHGKYLDVERSYNVGQMQGIFDVYKTGSKLKKMGDASFYQSISWVPCPQDNFLTYWVAQNPPMWQAARIGSLDIFCTVWTNYTSRMVATTGKGSVALLADDNISVRAGATLLGPFPVTDVLPGEYLVLMYFDGKTVVIGFNTATSSKLRAYRVKATGLSLVAGPVNCGSILYSDYNSMKGVFAFSDMAGAFRVFTPKLKLVGQATGGPPFFQGRSVLLMDLVANPHTFTIYSW